MDLAGGRDPFPMVGLSTGASQSRNDLKIGLNIFIEILGNYVFNMENHYPMPQSYCSK